MIPFEAWPLHLIHLAAYMLFSDLDPTHNSQDHKSDVEDSLRLRYRLLLRSHTSIIPDLQGFH